MVSVRPNYLISLGYLALNAPIATSRLLFSSAEMFKKPLWQTVWTQIGAVCYGFTLFASILNSSVMLGNYLQRTTSADDISDAFFSLHFKG